MWLFGNQLDLLLRAQGLHRIGARGATGRDH